MKKRFVSMLLVLSMCMGLAVPGFAAEEVNEENEWHIATVLQEIIHEDGSTTLVIQDENGVQERTYYPTTTEINPSARLSWDGWNNPSKTQYDATAENVIQGMRVAALALFIGKAFGIAAAIAEVVAKPLWDGIQKKFFPDQRTIWLERTIWLKNDYSAYRRQDSFYQDKDYTVCVYEDSIREFMGGNR